MKVCKQQCNQCLFSPNKVVSDKRRTQIIQECVKEQKSFECHKSTIAGGESVTCNGFYNRLGEYSQDIRIAGRLGAIEFVDV